MKRRILSLVMALSMMFTLLPMNVFATEIPASDESNPGMEEILPASENPEEENGGNTYIGEQTPLTFNGDAEVTLNGVTITASEGVSAISIMSGNVTLNLVDESTLTGGKGGAGIYVAEGASVTITGAGKLTAIGNGGADTSDSGAAGIGGTNASGNSGAITIDGATVVAKGYGVHGSGIGSGSGKVVGEIKIINGADVTAYGGYYADGAGTKLQSSYGKSDPEGGAAIGGGGKTVSTIADIIITDSKVVAYGGSKAAGIGANFWCDAGTITISGNSNVTAQGGSSSAGIGTSRIDKGTGYPGSEFNIVINGGTVNATGGAYGAGIGAGYNADSVGKDEATVILPAATITIEGGNVNATGGEGGAGIGGGYKANNVAINITGGSVTATAGALVSGKGVANGGDAYAIGSGAWGSGVFAASPGAVIAEAATVTTTSCEGSNRDIEVDTSIKGTITEDMTWNDGDVVKGVTISGDVTITVNGTVTIAGTIRLSPDAISNVTFNGENNAKLIRGGGFTGQMFYAEGVSGNFQNLIFNNITLDGGAVWTGDVDKTLNRGKTNEGVKATGSVLYLVYANADLNNSVLQNHDDSTGEKANAVFLRYDSTIDFNKSVVANNNSVSSYYRGGVITVRQGGTVTTDNAEVYGNSGVKGGFFGTSSTGSYGGVVEVSNSKFHNNYADNGAVFDMQCNSNRGYLLIDGCEFYENASNCGLIYEHAYSRPVTIKASSFHDNECAVWDCHADPVLNISGKFVVEEDPDYTKYLFETPLVIGGALPIGASIAMSEASISKLVYEDKSPGYIATEADGYTITNKDMNRFQLPEGYKLVLADVNGDGRQDVVPVKDSVVDRVKLILKDSLDEKTSETQMVSTAVACLPVCEFTHDGFVFAGWVDADGNAVEKQKFTQTVTLTATWKLTAPTVKLSRVDAVLTATVTNAAEVEGYAYTYQWYMDNVAIEGADSKDYTMTDANSHSYKCVVTASYEDFDPVTGSASGTSSAPAVAVIGDAKYATLAQAVTAAKGAVDEEGNVAPATVTLLKDVTLGEKLTISGNVTISGEKTITRDAAYTGTLFTVNSGATLTLDGGLVIDGGNAWTYTKTPLDMDMANGAGTYVDNHITPAECGVNANDNLIVNNGILNANKVTVQNSYSTKGVSAINCGANSVTTLSGATLQNIAANGSGAVVYVGGADAVLTIKGDTRITGNFGISNGGIIQNYGQGTTVNLEGGSIDNNHVGKSGTLYASYSGNANKINTFNMSGGIITKNIMEGYGPIYIHTNTVWNMTGGEISENTSFLPSYVRNNNPAGTMTGGEIVNNNLTCGDYSNGYYATHPDLRLNGKTEITGGTFTQDVTEYLAPDTGLVYDEATGKYTTTDHVYNLYFRDPVTHEQLDYVGPLQGNDPARAWWQPVSCSMLTTMRWNWKFWPVLRSTTPSSSTTP